MDIDPYDNGILLFMLGEYGSFKLPKEASPKPQQASGATSFAMLPAVFAAWVDLPLATITPRWREVFLASLRGFLFG